MVSLSFAGRKGMKVWRTVAFENKRRVKEVSFLSFILFAACSWLSFLKVFIIFIYMRVSICIYVVSMQVPRGQKRPRDPSELELQAVMHTLTWMGVRDQTWVLWKSNRPLRAELSLSPWGKGFVLVFLDAVFCRHHLVGHHPPQLLQVVYWCYTHFTDEEVESTVSD